MRLTKVIQKQANGEPVWHIILAVVIAIGLQLLLSDSLVLGSKYVTGVLEAILLIVLILPGIGQVIKRLLSIGLIGLIASLNLVSLGLVVHALITGEHSNGHQLLLSSVAIYLTNIIVFGIMYWELDETKPDEADFLFPQFASNKEWTPTFFDYLYVSVTNATAFSPTDTLPLTHRAKLLMTVQGITALITIALVTARAVNILG